MSKKKGKEKFSESGDGFSQRPGPSGSSSKETSVEFESPKHKKPKEKPQEMLERREPQSHAKKVKSERKEGTRKGDPFHSRPPPKQEQRASVSGSSPGPPPQQQQSAWSRGPPASAPPKQEQQSAWGRGPPASAPPKQEQQSAWGRGPPASAPPKQEQQSAWGRGPPASAPPKQEQQSAWGRGPPASAPPKQEQQRAWGRGPPTSAPPKQEQQSAWGRGPPTSGPPKQEQQSAWGRGPPISAPPKQEQQSAWSGGPPTSAPPKQEQQSAWGRGPPTSGPPPQQQEQVSSIPGTSQKFRIPKKSEGKEKEKGEPEKPQSSGSTDVFVFAPRITAPKKSGRPIVVATNFFPLKILNPNITAYHYDVVIEPDKPKFLMREVWNKYVSMMFPGRLTAFDGKNAYSCGPLNEDGSSCATVTVLNKESNREKEFKVSIHEVRRISLSCFQNYRERLVQSRAMKTLPEAEMAILDIILRNWACDNFIRSTRHFFPLSSSNSLVLNLSAKLDLRVGYFQSAFLGYKPYLNFDISHKGFYKECPVLNIADEFTNRRTGALEIEEMNHFMRNVKVEYQIPNDPSSKKIFRVNKLVNDANKQKFRKEDNSELTVARYFETEKKYKLRHPNLPLLWVGPTQKSIYLPMELCRIAPDQIYRGVMDSYETREMVRNATSNARDRKRDVYSLFEKANINSHPLMREFGLQVSDEMEKVPARILDPPRLKTSRNIRVEEGVWRIQDLLEPKRLNKWCILNLDNRANKQSLMNFQQMLKTKGIEYKMEISDPLREPLNGEPNFASMKKAFSQLKDMEMVFVVISESKGLYSKVKAICETIEGILTQCVKSRTLMQDPRKLTTTVQNILLKVNAKLGGKNHCLDKSSVPECLNGYVMIVGADVTHPSPGMKIPSVAAVTVSCDPAAFQYGTTTRVQPKGEMIKDLEEIISIHLKKFYQIRKKYPEKIIFFRDGVSEGELPKVFKCELLALKRACNGYCQPKVTFVIVQKRHHTRLYPTSSADEQGRNYNVPVGTCVDTDIVHPRDLDFYLVSHASILGTARPTRYRLLHDDNQLTDEQIETLSYYLCHLFSRCNRSVSYPSPTYNAHLAAARVRAHLEGLNLMGGEDIDIIKKKLPDHISTISPMYFV